MSTSVIHAQSTAVRELPVEIVERKGIGHPDTLADALAERLSVAYSRYCREHYGAVLHHNLDKLYLRGGHSRSSLGHHEMTAPTVLEIGGRISSTFAGKTVPYRELFEQTAYDYLATVLPHFDARTWLKFEHSSTDRSRFPTWFQPRDLNDLPELTRATSSDTVAVTAWWPNTPTENLVLALERHLNQEATGPCHDHLGQDIKIMAIRSGQNLDVVAGVPIRPQTVHTSDAYAAAEAELTAELGQVIEKADLGMQVNLRVNTSALNPFGAKKHYLLGAGTCLECGEEGFVGRGNTASGLIPIHRPKSVEAPYGKNPTYHAGKVYSIYADQIAQKVNEQLDVAATVSIVASHSDQLREPGQVVVDTDQPTDRRIIDQIVAETLTQTDHLAMAVDHEAIVPR